MPGERGMARDGRGPRLAGPANRLSQRACFTSWASSMARVLAFTAAIVLRAPLGTLAQDVRAAPPSTLTGILANNQTCLFHNDCPGDRFCLQPPGSQYRGNCYQCWRCCLFPDIWGACPEQCNCNRGSACAQPQDCGQGLFCATEPTRLTAQPLCQPCTGCFTDSQEISGACSSSCPSASLSYSGFTSASSSVTQFVFLAFLAYEISPSTASSADVGTMSQDDLTAWLNWEGLNKNKSQLVLSALTAAQPAPVSVLEFISVLTKLDSTSISCPSIQSLPLATTVEQGCACNATEGAVTFRCPAGQRCSSAQFKLLSSDALNNPSAIRTRAVCVPCSPSQYCPEGTFVKDELDLASLDCPAGFYCPTPAEVQPCPAGSYCVPRTVTPLSCDYDKLLAAAPFTKLPVESNTVLERLRDHGDPYKGNICPVSSTEPNNLCRGGYFCPSPSVSYLCPEGHFCKPQSISPRKCSILTRCPAGTSSPRWSILAFVILSVVLVALPLTHWTLRRIDSSSTRYEDLERFELKRNKAIKVTRQLLQSIKARSMAGKSAEMNAEMQAKYAGFGMVEPRIRLDFEQLGLTLPGQGHVLEGVSGYFPPGKMSAVMGPSGSGKTTFLNVLCGKASGVVTGQVLVNGIPMSIGQTHKITGFVPQDDIVHEDLTVRENLSYAAHMKLPRDLADGHTRKAVIDDALEMLQLKHIQHYRVGSVEKRGISGGQRKRVNIGIELVGSPSVLFLDEPTSGLDSTASNDILKSLADMAALGMNVIAVIHQPRFSSFMLFDQVLLLGHGGTTVFMGPPGVAVLYFEVGLGFTMPPRENPADVLMDIIGGKVTREGDARFKPAQLSEWWVSRGQEWVSEFCRLNQGQAGDIIAVEPGMIEHMEDEFDRVDEECTGRVGVDGLMEIFESLGHTLDVDDAKLLMKRMYHGQYGGNKDGGDEDDEVMSDDLTVTREQLVELFQSMSERTRTNGRIEALERYQSDKMTFNYPKIDVTGMLSNPTTRAPSQAGDGPSCTNTTQCTPRHGHNDHLRADESVLIGSNGGYAGPADGTASPTELIISDSRTPLGEANDRLTGGRPTFNEITASWSAKVAWDAGDGQVPGLAAMSSRTSLDQARDGAGLASLVEAVTQRVNALGSSGRIFPEPTTVIPRLGTWTDAGDSRAHHISRSYPATPRDPEAPPACRPLSARDSHQSNVHTATMQLADVRSFLNARDARPMGEAIEEDGAEVDRMRSIAEGQISPGKHQPAALASAEVEDFREASSSLPVSSSPYFTGLLDSNGTPGSPYGQSPLAGTAVSHHNSGLQVSGGGLPYIRSMLGMQGLAPESSSSLSRAAVTAKVSGLGPPSPLREKGGTSTPGKDPRERQYVDKLLMGVMASHASMHALGPTSSSRSKTVQQRLGLISTTNSVLKPQQASSIFPVAPSGPSTLPQRIMSVWRMGSNVGLVQLSDKSRARLAVASAAAAAQGLKDQEELVTLLQERSFPGFLTQVQLLLRRGILQYVRNFWPTKVIDVALLLLASFIIGSIHGTNWSLNSVPTNSVMSMTCLGVLSTVTHLRTFSQHRLLMWRETASGISMPAYFLASNMIDLIWIVTAPSLFLGPYYYLTLPRMAWTSFFLVGLQVCWWASGMAYLVSAVLPPTTVLIAGVFLALIMGSFLQGLTPTVASARGSGLEVFMGISYNRWAMEILSINEFQHYQDNLRNVMIMIAKSVGICGLDTQLVDDGQPGLSPREAISFLRIQESFSFALCSKYTTTAHLALLFMGMGTRVLAYLCLWLGPKKQY